MFGNFLCSKNPTIYVVHNHKCKSWLTYDRLSSLCNGALENYQSKIKIDFINLNKTQSRVSSSESKTESNYVYTQIEKQDGEGGKMTFNFQYKLFFAYIWLHRFAIDLVRYRFLYWLCKHRITYVYRVFVCLFLASSLFNFFIETDFLFIWKLFFFLHSQFISRSIAIQSNWIYLQSYTQDSLKIYWVNIKKKLSLK